MAWNPRRWQRAYLRDLDEAVSDLRAELTGQVEGPTIQFGVDPDGVPYILTEEQ